MATSKMTMAIENTPIYVSIYISYVNQTPLVQHIYPPHHVVRIGMLDSQQSGRTSN